MGIKGFDGVLFKCRCKNYLWRIVYQFQHFKSVDLWHLNIQENKVWLMELNGFHAFKTIVALFCHGYARVGLQVFFYHHACKGFVVYDYYFHELLF